MEQVKRKHTGEIDSDSCLRVQNMLAQQLVTELSGEPSEERALTEGHYYIASRLVAEKAEEPLREAMVDGLWGAGVNEAAARRYVDELLGNEERCRKILSVTETMIRPGQPLPSYIEKASKGYDFDEQEFVRAALELRLQEPRLPE